MHRDLLLAVYPIMLLSLCALAACGCEEKVEGAVGVTGFNLKDIDVELEDIGRLSEAEVDARKSFPDVDGISRVPPGSCPGRPCRFAQLTVYVRNAGTDAIAPPVVRLDAPKARPPRQPVAFGAQRVDVGRTGRIRWLVELWPEEKALKAHLSSSVFLDVTSFPAPPDKGDASKKSNGEAKEAPPTGAPSDM